MSLKREVSQSIANLQHSVKRLALGEENTDLDETITPKKIAIMEDDEVTDTPILESVLSTSKAGFDLRYQKLGEIGRGGFSVVYKCRDNESGNIYAVKIIDLRPLRLREKFNPTRLRREVDIMRQLRHPNVIQFVEVYETEDQLMVVMEYAPGKELFDVILERKFFSEDDAKPLFRQIASAVNHLHSMDIIHRDIKPENILVLNEKDQDTGLPVAKLLDFGLSKHAGLGSAARTFVGTPCYQAPEVEFTGKGLGGTYGAAADCWSLGAVLYVMLVARFPEFDHNVGYQGRKVLRLPDALWSHISLEAKSLIQGLMCYETDVRLTAADALRHEWLGSYRIVDEEAGVSSYTGYPPSRGTHQIPPSIPAPKGGGTRGNDVMDMVLSDKYSKDVRRQAQQSTLSSGQTFRMQNGINLPPAYTSYGLDDSYTTGTSSSAMDMGLTVGSHHVPSSAADHLPLAPLLHLQRNIAATFEKAHIYYMHNPELASHVRTAAVMCRQQILDSTTLLRKIEQTSLAVLNMFPDLELAVEEDVPELAISFFDMVRTWVGELITLVNTTQKGNQTSINQLQLILNLSHQETSQQRLNAVTLSMHNRGSGSTSVNMSDVRDAVVHLKERAGVKPLSGNDILELFSNLFGQDQWKEKGVLTSSPRTSFNVSGKKASSLSSGHSSSDAEDLIIGGSPNSRNRQSGNDRKENSHPSSSTPVKDVSFEFGSPAPTPDDMDIPSDMPSGDKLVAGEDNMVTRYEKVKTGSGNGKGEVESKSGLRFDQMESALDMLRQVDLILEQLGIFWANTEVVLDALTKKGQHAEHFVGFARNPKLMQRFKDRINEYRHFWEGVTSMCHTYLLGIVEPEDSLSRFTTPPEEVLSQSSSTSSTHSYHKQESGTSSSSSNKQSSTATASYLYGK